MVQFVVGEEVDEGFSTMKTEEMAHKASKTVRAVTYNMASIRGHVTQFFAVMQRYKTNHARSFQQSLIQGMFFTGSSTDFSTYTIWPCDTRNSVQSHVLMASASFHTDFLSH